MAKSEKDSCGWWRSQKKKKKKNEGELMKDKEYHIILRRTGGKVGKWGGEKFGKKNKGLKEYT